MNVNQKITACKDPPPSKPKTLPRNESIEISEKDANNFSKKYGDTKTHLHNLKDLHLDHLNFIGFGTFSAVKKGYSSKYKQDVAVKIINVKDKRNKLYVSKYLQNEMQLWKELSKDDHLNVLSMKEHIATPHYHYVVTDAIAYGDLDKLILRRSLSEGTSRRMAKGIVDAVVHCHGKGIAHRDIKPANVLVGSDMTLKLADFTFATRTNPVCKSNCGTQAMLAPEQCSRGPYNPFVSDLWQVGVTFYMILFKDMPYKKQRRKHLLAEMKGLINPYKGVPIPYDVSVECKELLAGMLNIDPSARINIRQAKTSTWWQLE